MNKIILISLSITVVVTLNAQTYIPTSENLAMRQVFQDNKFGMFIHWGASSVLGDGEWVMNIRNIRIKDYSRLQHVFNPQAFDAKRWVSAARSAGMKYITFVTRHHDGFSNWDTQQSDWKITNTPYGKDVLKQLADECHKQGIKLVCYYSLVDWYHSDYQYETGRTGKGSGRSKKSNWENYIRFMKAQLTELLTNYGEIAGIWFDGHWDQLDYDQDRKPAKVNWYYDEIYSLIHQLQPHCLISNNHHQAIQPGEDIQAFEKDLPGDNTAGFGGAAVSALPLETCETMNNSWGYNITDGHYKTVKQLVQYLVKAAGNNANFLLNVGPMPDGTIQKEFTDTLQAIGTWINGNGESVYGTRGAIIPPQPWGVVTAKANTMFVHILQKPQQGQQYIFIPGLQQKIAKAFLWNGNKAVKIKQQAEGVFIYLDAVEWNDTDTIIQLLVK